MPSASKLVNGPAGKAVRTASARKSLPEPITFMSGRAQVKIDWKTRKSTTRNTSVPYTRWVSTRSRRSVQETRPLRRPLDAALQYLANPGVTRPRLHSGHAATRRRQPLPGTLRLPRAGPPHDVRPGAARYTRRHRPAVGGPGTPATTLRPSAARNWPTCARTLPGKARRRQAVLRAPSGRGLRAAAPVPCVCSPAPGRPPRPACLLRRSRSNVSPCDSATSIMFSATTTGTPSSRTCVVR